MKRALVVMLITFFAVSCSNHTERRDTIAKRSEVLTGNVLSLGTAFSPFIDKSKDSIVFVFSKRASFDTSWILVLKKAGSEIYACYNQIMPSYHRGVHDYLDETNKLLAYEGLVFRIDTTKLNNIISDLGLKKKHFEDGDSIGCVDCTYYTLYYGERIFRSTRQSQKFLDSVGKSLKFNILNPLLVKSRSPRW